MGNDENDNDTNGTDEAKEKKVSEKQWNANRENAKKSTGPKTTRGKAIASLNSLIHGILAKRTIATGPPLLEDPAEFVVFLEALRESWSPVGAAEDLKVQELASVAIRRVRLERYETAGINERAVLAVVADNSRNTDERFDTLQKGFAVGSAADSSTLPHVSAKDLRAQIDLVKRLHSKAYSIETAPEFLTFVYFEKCDPNDDQPDFNQLKLDQIRESLERLTEAEREDLKGRFVEQSEILLREFWKRRAISVSHEASIERSLIPDGPDLDKIIRYAAHLRREEVRIIAILEAMQAARKAKQRGRFLFGL